MQNSISSLSNANLYFVAINIATIGYAIWYVTILVIIGIGVKNTASNRNENAFSDMLIFNINGSNSKTVTIQ
jgi:hypothetical protein